MTDAARAKIVNIQRCVRRAREEYETNKAGFKSDYTHQDAAILNVLRACESAIGLANHVVRAKQWGIPAASADAFDRLAEEGAIDAALAERLRRMAAFRNIAIHQYTDLDLDIVVAVLDETLDDLIAFGDAIGKVL